MSTARTLRRAAPAVVAALLTACSLDRLVGSDRLPTDVSDPASLHTPAGALAAYVGTVGQFRAAYGSPSGFVLSAGLLSDELNVASDEKSSMDLRILPEFENPETERNESGMSGITYVSAYADLHKLRGQAMESIRLLRDYAPAESPALRGHLYALQGYAEIMLAELFCSGIPLSTVDAGGGYTLQPGTGTAEVLEHALVLLDSALALSADSARITNLARVGRARALLGLGRVADAAAAVASVPDDFAYAVSFNADFGAQATSFAELSAGVWRFSTSDREGGNGLDYRASDDPRTQSLAIGTTWDGRTIFHPAKYLTDGSSPIVLASGVEARLVRAEAALDAGDAAGALAILDELRRTAITPALPALDDPGTPEARVDLLMRERAAWLYLTGQRQGDMRRLVRHYGRPSTLVYAVGVIPGTPYSYGSDVTAPIPAREREYNPLFRGCINRDA